MSSISNSIVSSCCIIWKVKRFAILITISLLHRFLWSSWKIKMMSWYHKFLCQLILGEYRWIYPNVSRWNNLEGKQYHFLKSIQVDKQEELSRKWRIKLLYKELQVRDQIEWSVVTSEECEEAKRRKVWSVKRKTRWD